MYRFRGKKQPDIQLFIKNLQESERMERQIVLENEKKLTTTFFKMVFYQSSSIINILNDDTR